MEASDVIKDDVMEGLYRCDRCSRDRTSIREGQTKEVLGTAVLPPKIVSTVVRGPVERIFRDVSAGLIRQNGKLIMEKVAAASCQLAHRCARSQGFTKTQRMRSNLHRFQPSYPIADLKSVTRAELFIVEGDSALGTTKAARNSEFQAILPIPRKRFLQMFQRHRFLKCSMTKNAAPIIRVSGAGSGKSFELDEARYGRIILMSDADDGGAHGVFAVSC
jgi:DNA gyrase subunit B